MRTILALCAALIFSAPLIYGEETPAKDFTQPDPKVTLKEFDRQVERLKSLGYVELFGGEEKFHDYFGNEDAAPAWMRHPYNLRAQVQNEALYLQVENGNMPLLVVVPRNYAPLLWQLSKIVVDADIRIEPTQIDVNDVELQPGARRHERPYVIFNVRPGQETMNESASSCASGWEAHHPQRRGLALEEGLALLQQFPDTSKYVKQKSEDVTFYAFGRMCFLNSAYRVPENIPTLIVLSDKRGKSVMHAYYTQQRDLTPNYAHYQFPSCSDETRDPEK